MAQMFWGLTSKLGLRPVSWLGVWYRDTYFSFDVKKHPEVQGLVALTIDDGLCRQDESCSMTKQVSELLKEHQAEVTFFLCGEYCKGSKLEAEGRELLKDGHEFGNHCSHDREFASLDAEEFQTDLKQTAEQLEDKLGSPKLRWFRAPQARYTKSMRHAIEGMEMRHALGDCYCDDWLVEDAEWIADTLLKQVHDGSIIIMHMPEHGYREHTFEALKLLLEGLSKRNLRSVTLSSLVELAEGSRVGR
jgi:peptidoglycan/xylan/chitin deacetylase (PgdA/CDA1 family)